jgi:hypothetical protein
MLLRVRGPSGQTTLSGKAWTVAAHRIFDLVQMKHIFTSRPLAFAGVEPETTLAEFLSLIESKTGVAVGAQEILSGFPPRPVPLPDNDAASTIASLGIKAGDSLTVRQCAGATLPSSSSLPATQVAGPPNQTATDAMPAPPQAAAEAFSLQSMSEDEQLARAIAASLGEDISQPPSAPAPALVAEKPPPRAQQQQQQPGPPLQAGEPGYEPLKDGRAIARRIVADDNSCLFSAVGLVTRGSRDVASSLRSVVADAITADPFEWNEAVLGKDPLEYAMWIKDPKRWGGAIELSILSRRLEVEIAAFDIQTERIDVYGYGEGHNRRVMVVYDGENSH